MLLPGIEDVVKNFGRREGVTVKTNPAGCGLLVSQMLTLFTTPVIYLWFDRLAVRFSGRPDPAGQTSRSG